MKQYEVNNELRIKMIKEQHKKHPKWKKRVGVRIILQLLLIVGTIMVAYFLYDSNGSNNIFMLLVGAIAGALIFVIPYGIYYFALRTTCRNFIDYKNKEMLVLSEEGIKNIYLPVDAKRDYMYEEDNFQYTKIQRLVYNQYYNTLDIYGYYKKKWYKNYFDNIVGTERGIKDKNNKLTLFLYYYNSEELINTIVKKSGVRLEVISSEEI